MMEFLANYGLFLLKTVTLVIGFLAVLIGIIAASRKTSPGLEITSLNKEYETMAHHVQASITGSKVTKKKKATKAEISAKKDRPRLFVCEFTGDMKATQVDSLKEVVTAILTVATEKDEVVLKLESPGGAVNGYGLAASQLKRIRDKKIHLTVCIDKVAASGGYLMACIANTIVAAPFSILGSIGVVSQIPNFHRWLKKHNIDVELLTSGEYKRTLTLLGENTEKGRKKFQEDLEKIHHAFKEAVLSNRQQLDIDKVSTGEHWLAVDAFHLRLVDQLKTSDEYLISKLENFNVYKLALPQKVTWVQRMLKPAVAFLRPEPPLSF